MLAEILNKIWYEMHVQFSNKYWLIILFIEQIREHISNTCPEYHFKSMYTSETKFAYTEK